MFQRLSPLTLALNFVWVGGCADWSTPSDSPGGSGGEAGESTGGSGAGGSGTGGGFGGSGGFGGESRCVPTQNALGRIDTPSPLISVDKPVVASPGVQNPENLVDGLYHSNSSAVFGEPRASASEWASIDVGEGPTRLLLTWADSGWTPYNVQTGGAPADYSVEVSADSTDGEDGTWSEVVAVTENLVRTRGHSFDFGGMRWVRFVATGPAADSAAVRIDELALYDITQAGSERPQDTWLFMGDSITQAAHHREFGASGFEGQVTMAHPDYTPALLNAGIGGELATHGLAHIEEWLELNPDFQHIALGYGTNDAWGNKNVESVGFEDTLRELIEVILDAGRTPHLGRIPFATAAHSTLPSFNAVIDALVEEYELPCGPDLYTWFQQNDQLGTDGVHPARAGYISINRLWAESASVLYVDP